MILWYIFLTLPCICIPLSWFWTGFGSQRARDYQNPLVLSCFWTQNLFPAPGPYPQNRPDGLWDSCIFGARFGGRSWTHKPLCICYSSRLVYFSAVTKNILGLTPNWARSRDLTDFMSPELFPRSSFQIQHEKTQWREIDEQWQRSIEPRFRKSSDRKTHGVAAVD